LMGKSVRTAENGVKTEEVIQGPNKNHQLTLYQTLITNLCSTPRQWADFPLLT